MMTQVLPEWYTLMQGFFLDGIEWQQETAEMVISGRSRISADYEFTNPDIVFAFNDGHIFFSFGDVCMWHTDGQTDNAYHYCSWVPVTAGQL